MKPLHGEFKRLSRCPCCQSRYSKHNAGKKSKSGKKASRSRSKLKLKRRII